MRVQVAASIAAIEWPIRRAVREVCLKANTNLDPENYAASDKQQPLRMLKGLVGLDTNHLPQKKC